MRIQWFQEIKIDRAAADLPFHIIERTRIKEVLNRHAQHTVCHHLPQTDAKGSRTLRVKRDPEPANAIHQNDNRRCSQEEIKAVVRNGMKILSSKCPKEFHLA